MTSGTKTDPLEELATVRNDDLRVCLHAIKRLRARYDDNRNRKPIEPGPATLAMATILFNDITQGVLVCRQYRFKEAERVLIEMMREADFVLCILGNPHATDADTDLVEAFKSKVRRFLYQEGYSE